MKRILLLSLMILYSFQYSNGQTTVNLNPIQDNSIYSLVPVNSNGLGSIFSGVPNNGAPIRGLIQFDIANNVPATATITNAVLTLFVEQRGNLAAPPEPYDLHAVITPWGEGPSIGGGPGGGVGVAGMPPDATWVNSMLPGAFWIAPGGDFVPAPSATSFVPPTPINPGVPVVWAAAPMIADVQNWFNTPATNFGWILKQTFEPNVGLASRFGSKDLGMMPVLAVTYTLPLDIEEEELSTLSVYPNPTKDVLNIDMNEGNSLKEIVVYNLLGQQVHHSTFNGESNKTIDISNIYSGMYLMKIITENGSTIRRIIKN